MSLYSLVTGGLGDVPRLLTLGLSTGAASTTTAGAGYPYSDEAPRKLRAKRLIVGGEFIYSDDPRLKQKLIALAEQADEAAKPAEPVVSAKQAEKAVQKARKRTEKPAIIVPEQGAIDPQTLALIEAYQAQVQAAFERGLMNQIARLEMVRQIEQEDEEILLMMEF